MRFFFKLLLKKNELESYTVPDLSRRYCLPDLFTRYCWKDKGVGLKLEEVFSWNNNGIITCSSKLSPTGKSATTGICWKSVFKCVPYSQVFFVSKHDSLFAWCYRIKGLISELLCFQSLKRCFQQLYLCER